MKKLILLFATIGLLAFSCTDDLQKDIDDLKGRVSTLEASETVVSLEFQGNDLIVTFGDGSTASITAPVEVIPDHVSDFSIDTETNLITITFSDGTSSQYTVFSNGNSTYMSGTLTGDYGITSMTMGDVTLANLAYDGQNRMVEAMINLPDGNGNVVNILELHNNYAAANPTAIAIEKSLYADINYNVEEWLSSETAYFPGDSGYSFVLKDGEMYTYYTDRYYNSYNNTDYRYNSHPYCWFVEEDDIDYNNYKQYFPVPGEDSLFYKSYGNYNSMEIDNVYGRLYYPSEIIRVTEIFEAGVARDTMKTMLTMRDDNLIEKVEFLEWDSDAVEAYYELIYDNNQLLTNIDFYDVRNYQKKSATPEDPRPEHYMRMNMTYTESLLTSLDVDYYDNEGAVEETIEVGQMVYDDAGNPVEIWSSQFDYNNDNGSNFVVDPSGKISIEPKNNELKKIVEIEYNYTLPNFFGKTLEYLIPELKGLSIKNAPVRITQSGFFNFAQMEYFDFNEGGYPAKVKLDANIQTYYDKSASMDRSPSIPLGTEMDLEYTLFE